MSVGGWSDGPADRYEDSRWRRGRSWARPVAPDRPGPRALFSGRAALCDQQHPDRFHRGHRRSWRPRSPDPDPRSPGSVHRVERVRLALPSPTCRFGRSTSMTLTNLLVKKPGQTDPIGPGPLDPPDADLPEPAQPAHPAADSRLSSRGTSPRPAPPPTASSTAATCSSRCASHATRHRARALYDGHRHPFSHLKWSRGGTHVP